MNKTEKVVLVDDDGNKIGLANKSEVHTSSTPLHRAFSIFIFNNQGQLLLQQRALSKITWPGVWSNSCCGHPGDNESSEHAASRRLFDELNLRVSERNIYNILPDYSYRAEMHGIVENEICPVLIAFTEDNARPNPDEVEAVRWVNWKDFLIELDKNNDYSPWCNEEAKLLDSNKEFIEIYNKLVSDTAN